jgi:hypothetical protein
VGFLIVLISWRKVTENYLFAEHFSSKLTDSPQQKVLPNNCSYLGNYRNGEWWVSQKNLALVEPEVSLPNKLIHGAESSLNS